MTGTKTRLLDQGVPYTLPSGKKTNSWKRYEKEWLELVTPVCEATGAELFAMIPGVGLRHQGVYIQLTVPFLKVLNKALNKAKE